MTNLGNTLDLIMCKFQGYTYKKKMENMFGESDICLHSIFFIFVGNNLSVKNTKYQWNVNKRFTSESSFIYIFPYSFYLIIDVII